MESLTSSVSEFQMDSFDDQQTYVFYTKTNHIPLTPSTIVIPAHLGTLGTLLQHVGTLQRT